ncbi:developmental pluripotency-associated protein 4-like isoform X2 [Xenia sp. Carnegie-2017]|nr:developmental pluripotency-associated protein 4-like isoform X2 [Xenia sp. Carnegie-2017]XP_046856504.1 developmental pluripotency-associated protein 4-like isoform X2 [Xenia sp. Carnegie-2017]
MGCKMTKGKKSKKTETNVEETHVENIPKDLKSLKRRDLQALCKKHKLKAIGKNSELIERLRQYFETIQLSDIGTIEEAHENAISDDNNSNHVSPVLDKDECDLSITTKPSEKAKETLNSSTPKANWEWVAHWCVVDGVLKQDAADQWVLLQLVGGRPLIIDKKTKARLDFVLEPTVLPTPEDCEDNYICGDCVRKNQEKLSGWITLRKSDDIIETPKSSLGKENMKNNSLHRQSFKRKREDVLSPFNSSDFIEITDSPSKLRRLDSRSCSPASPQVRRERGEDLLPKNLLKPFKPKKAKNTPPREDADYALKVENIITNLDPEEQRNLVFGLKSKALPRSPTNLRKVQQNTVTGNDGGIR